jgi:hypothetical protein
MGELMDVEILQEKIKDAVREFINGRIIKHIDDTYKHILNGEFGIIAKEDSNKIVETNIETVVEYMLSDIYDAVDNIESEVYESFMNYEDYELDEDDNKNTLYYDNLKKENDKIEDMVWDLDTIDKDIKAKIRESIEQKKLAEKKEIPVVEEKTKDIKKFLIPIEDDKKETHSDFIISHGNENVEIEDLWESSE